MKTRFQFFLLIFCSFFILGNLCAQDMKKVVKKTKKRTERKIERKVENKMDDAVDKTLDGIFGSKKKKRQEEAEKQMTDYPEAVEEVPVVFPENDFLGSFKMQILSGDETWNYKLTFDNYQTGIRDLDADEKKTWIIDHKEGKIVAVQNQSQGFRSEVTMPQSELEEDPELAVLKTGDSRESEGLLCYKYFINASVGKSTVWIAEEFSVPMALIIHAMAKQSPGFKVIDGLAEVRGIPVEFFMQRSDGTQARMVLSDLRKGVFDISEFDLTGVEIIDVSALEPYPKK